MDKTQANVEIYEMYEMYEMYEAPTLYEMFARPGLQQLVGPAEVPVLPHQLAVQHLVVSAAQAWPLIILLQFSVESGKESKTYRTLLI